MPSKPEEKPFSHTTRWDVLGCIADAYHSKQELAERARAMVESTISSNEKLCLSTPTPKLETASDWCHDCAKSQATVRTSMLDEYKNVSKNKYPLHAPTSRIPFIRCKDPPGKGRSTTIHEFRISPSGF